MKTLIILFAALLLGSAQADPRIRTEIYDSSVVYNVNAQVGVASLIQFENGESLVISPSSVLGIGDGQAWDLGLRGNNMVIKPTKTMPQTNMIIVTNKRTYSFDLKLAAKRSAVTYILRFRYLDSEAAKTAAELAAEWRLGKLTALARGGKLSINTEYFWRGNNELLKPTAAYDDGRFTRLVYDHGGDLPVFFKVLPDGTEAVLNSNIDPDNRQTVVLHEVVRIVRARLGKEVIEIVNRAYQLPSLNQSGTGVLGTVRVDKGSAP